MYRWFRATLSGTRAPVFVLVRAKSLADAIYAVERNMPSRKVKEIVDAGDAWAVIDLRDLPEPADFDPLTELEKYSGEKL